MKRNWNNFYTAEDFHGPLSDSHNQDFRKMVYAHCAAIANALLKEALKDAKRVYGRNTEEGTKYEDPGDWHWQQDQKNYGDTHTALLICEKPLEEK